MTAAEPVGHARVCRMKLLQVQFYLAELGRWIEHALIAVCGILLCLMASSVFFEVLIRYVIHAPTAWTEETAQFVLVWYGLLAAAVGARKGVHFAIRWGVIRFSDRTRWIIRQGVNVVVIIFLSALLKLGLDYLDIVANQTSTGAEINMRIPWAGIPAGIGSILVIYVLEVADAVLSIWTGRQFSVKEAREEDIYRALRGETVPPAPVEASPLESKD
jgi:TRAP-type C4-dicarboxylate transport system permease small subunit